jgi:TRAP-type C4-dicarboxylate transport system permease large subunit
VGSCAFFGAMSGSGAATTAAVGQVLYKPLLKNGYSESFAAGVLASSGAIAVIIPPSIAMIIYGGSAEVSVVKLFIAGFLPGLLLATLMAIYIHIYARRKNMGITQIFQFREFIRASRAGILALMTPLLVPIVLAADIDLIHFGIIMVMNLEIGMFTPPFGLNIFVVQSVLKAPLAAIYRGVVPFIINIIALGIITYVPEVSLFLPSIIGP